MSTSPMAENREAPLQPAEVPPAGTFGALLRFKPPYPIRQKSANGVPPEPSEFMRRCARCSASFGLLAAGRSGEAGLWDGDRSSWYCSQECYDITHDVVTTRFGEYPASAKRAVDRAKGRAS